MIMKTIKKTRAEVMEDGLLPCGHPAEIEYDHDIPHGERMIIDYCFICGWRTPLRAASDDLNGCAQIRATAEQRLIEFIRDGDWTEAYESSKVIQLSVDARVAYRNELRQREIVRLIAEDDPYPY